MSMYRKDPLMSESVGRLITVEGLEGVGKTTNLHFIADWLNAEGVPFKMTREPGGTPFAEEIRQLLLTPREENVDPWSELMLIFAARAQHLNTYIRPLLAAGTWVLCDRFTDATYAYQGAGRGLPADAIATLEQMVQGSLRPDCTFLLDAPADVGLKRASARGDLDRFEQERHSFFDRARQVYLDRAKASPQRYAVLDAAQPLERVQADITRALERML